MQLKARAPGSLMLLGEHAVLHGKNAIVCAVDKYITATLELREDNRIIIYSALGNYSTDIKNIKIEKPFQFVLAALQSFQNEMQHGFELKIESEFSDKIGFGSSSAVTVATLHVLANYLNVKLSQTELVKRGRDIVRQIQGVGSGADIAASVYGGIVGYLSDPVNVETISVTLPLHAIYSGYKTKTADVIKHVKNKFTDNTDQFTEICDRIGKCSSDGIEFLHNSNMESFGHTMNVQQEMMQELGVSSDLLDGIIMDLRKQNNILGAKISGSGMGDCVIALGDLSNEYECKIQDKILQRIPIQIPMQGVMCEKI